jgi:hypothetical protein
MQSGRRISVLLRPVLTEAEGVNSARQSPLPRRERTKSPSFVYRRMRVILEAAAILDIISECFAPFLELNG